MVLSERSMGVQGLQHKSLCSYSSQARASAYVHTSILPHKCQHGFCSCCRSSAQTPHSQRTHTPAAGQLASNSSQLPPFHRESLWPILAADTGVQKVGRLWCNSHPRAPSGIRLKQMSAETTPLFSSPPPPNRPTPIPFLACSWEQGLLKHKNPCLSLCFQKY